MGCTSVVARLPTIRAGMCVNQLSDLTGLNSVPPVIMQTVRTLWNAARRLHRFHCPSRSTKLRRGFGVEFVQSNNEWCARACARLLALKVRDLSKPAGPPANSRPEGPKVSRSER